MIGKAYGLLWPITCDGNISVDFVGVKNVLSTFTQFKPAAVTIIPHWYIIDGLSKGKVP